MCCDRTMRLLWLSMALVISGVSTIRAEPPAEPRFVALDNRQAWALLPREDHRLPVWARILAEPLPRTTAAMLELDRVHRTENPLAPALRGKLRWVAADAIGSKYGKEYAEADLRRHGATQDDLDALAAGSIAAPPEERLALAFARQLTLDASRVTDEDVTALWQHFGSETLVAIVHTVAYANFQDRILLAFGVQVEEGGPLPPLDVRFDLQRDAEIPAPARPVWDPLDDKAHLADLQPEWRSRNPIELLQSLEMQKSRRPRIPLPDAERMAMLPADVQARAERIVWTKVSMGYQPGLTRAWFDAMNTFHKESALDELLANSVFWVITRTNDCFY